MCRSKIAYERTCHRNSTCSSAIRHMLLALAESMVAVAYLFRAPTSHKPLSFYFDAELPSRVFRFLLKPEERDICTSLFYYHYVLLQPLDPYVLSNARKEHHGVKGNKPRNNHVTPHFVYNALMQIISRGFQKDTSSILSRTLKNRTSPCNAECTKRKRTNVARCCLDLYTGFKAST